MRRYKRTTVVLLLLLSVVPFLLNGQFVEMRDGRFQLAEREFRFTGTNAYYLLHEAARGNTGIIDEVYSAARDADMTVIRTWAFYDDPDSRNALQSEPGVYSERVFRALDYLIYKAAEYNLRLILVLTNNWEDYGGSMQYVRWSPTATSRDDFYTDYYCRQYYRRYVHDVLTRTNTYTGLQYKDDPAIMAWELINEPTSNDESGRIVRQWIDEMAPHVRSVDPNHLIGVGGGGWDNSFILYERFLESVPVDQKRLHWMLNGSRGVSYALNIRSEHIDYASAHVYPDMWNLSLYQTVQWLRNLQSIAAGEGKPFVLGELGKRANRKIAFNTVLHALFASGGNGALIWQYPEMNRHTSGGYAFDGDSDPDAVKVLKNTGILVQGGEAFEFNVSIFEEKLGLPFYVIRNGSTSADVEALWYNVSVSGSDGGQRYTFGKRGTVELFVRGIFTTPSEGYVRIKARGDVRKIWVESRIRGQWLLSYSGYVSEYTEILVPLADLGLNDGHVERLKLFSEEGTEVYISEISITGSEIQR